MSGPGTDATRGTVWLVGMMGAGKSVVGRAVARRLERPFRDSDEEIERLAGARVAEIFEREGEAGFRARERSVLEELAGQPLVVALGGGAIAQEGMPERLAAGGTVVYLRARPETLAGRVGSGARRPLLAGLDADSRLARLRDLLDQREKAYATATLVVDVDELDVNEVVERVIAALEGSGR